MAEAFDIVVAGGGIAGLTAGWVSARLGRKVQVLGGHVIGGHLLSLEAVEGYPGFASGIAGYELCPIVQEQAAEAGAQVEMLELERIEPDGAGWRLSAGDAQYSARAVILATGTVLREVGVPGEERLRGKGVSHCASCDAPLLRGRDVAVVGGGDSAAQEALTLAKFASKVVLLHRGGRLSAQASYRDRIAAQPNVEVRFHSVVEEILGEDAVSGVRVRDAGGSSVLEAAGVFVYIGLAPNTGFLAGRLALDASGRIAVDAAMRTASQGIFAAGSVRAGSCGQAVGAAADGTAAAIAAHRYLEDGTW